MKSAPAFLAWAFSLICVGGAVPAQDLTGLSPPLGARIGPGSSGVVNAHNVCREVENRTGTPIMIPHATPAEWSVGPTAFLQNPYPDVNVSPCALWYWELENSLFQRCQAEPVCSEAEYMGGFPVTTRFPRYFNSNHATPSSPLGYSSLPDCGPALAGQQLWAFEQQGGPFFFTRTWVQLVCNRAAEIAPIILPDLTLRVGETGTVGQVAVSGLPHAGTEALIAGLGYVPADLSSRAEARLFRGGVRSTASAPTGVITPSSPYLEAFRTIYDHANFVTVPEMNQWQGFGFAVRNGDVVRVDVTAPATSGTYPMFVKLGDQVGRFTLTAEYPHVVQQVTCGLDATGVGTGWSPGCENQTGLGRGVNDTCSNLNGVEIYEQIGGNPPAKFFRAAVCVAR
jgi:hypothetical protein